MNFRPKCKLCGHEHFNAEPHNWKAAAPAEAPSTARFGRAQAAKAPSVPKSNQPKSVPKSNLNAKRGGARDGAGRPKQPGTKAEKQKAYRDRSKQELKT